VADRSATARTRWSQTARDPGLVGEPDSAIGEFNVRAAATREASLQAAAAALPDPVDGFTPPPGWTLSRAAQR
jgi:hypothetical protein